MFGNFLSNLRNGNIAEDMNRQEVESQVDHAQSMLEVSQQVRRRGEMHLEEVLDEEIAKKNRIRNELQRTQIELRRKASDNDYLRQENERLTRERAKLRETAINIAANRRAILNAVDYLSEKMPKDFIGDLCKEVEDFRGKDHERLMKDDSYITQLGIDLDNLIARKLERQKEGRT